MTLEYFREITKDLDGSQELLMADNVAVVAAILLGDIIYISDENEGDEGDE